MEWSKCIEKKIISFVINNKNNINSVTILTMGTTATRCIPNETKVNSQQYKCTRGSGRVYTEKA